MDGISLFQAGMLGFVSCLGASTPAAAGTTIGNYTLNRPLIGAVLVGLILGDLQGCILIAMPMQIIYIALVTPGGTVAADLRAVCYIGIPLAYVTCVSQGFALDSTEAFSTAGALGALVGTVGTVQFYGTGTMNLIWQHIGWARLDKKDLSIVGKVDALLPLITHFACSFIPVMLITYYGTGAVADFKEALPMDSWYMKALFTIGSLLPSVGIAILLKSVVVKPLDLLFFAFGFALAKSMGLTLIAASVVGAIFAVINYQITMVGLKKGAAGADDDEEDI